MRKQVILSLMFGLVIPQLAVSEGGDGVPFQPKPHRSEDFLKLRKEIDAACREEHPGEQGAVNECFLDSVHKLHEDGEISDELFGQLIREGEMRMAFFRGFSEAMKKLNDARAKGYQDGLRAGQAECHKGSEGGEPTDGEEPENQTPGNGGEGSKKVKVCHIPDGDASKAHTIEVPAAVVPKLLEKGDTLGECKKGEAGDKNKDVKKGGSKKKGKKNKKGKK